MFFLVSSNLSNLVGTFLLIESARRGSNAFTFGTVDFETGARIKAKRKGDTIRIDGIAEKGFEDRFDFDNRIVDTYVGKPYKVRSRWEQPFSATLIVEKDKVKSSYFQWGKDE